VAGGFADALNGIGSRPRGCDMDVAWTDRRDAGEAVIDDNPPRLLA
jgi:hypothetical protein